MAYVVARPRGRFEMRESFHTPKGPRSRTLAGFDVLSEEVLAAAARRAQRPFHSEAVIGSARRAGARVQVTTSRASTGRDRFLRASRRMASTLGQAAPSAERVDVGAALVELLGFADAVTAGQPPRPFEPLAFPALAHVAERRGSVATAHRP